MTTEKPTQLPPSPQSFLRVLRSHPWWIAVSGLVVFVGAALGALSSLSGLLGGPPWPVDPDIHFRDTNDGSSLILAFDITNKSGFRMPGVSFRCGVEHMEAIDALGHQVLVGGVAFFNGVKSISTTGTFDCNAADLLKVRADGSLAFRNSSTELQSRGRTIYQAPWRIIKMCVWVGGTYNFMGLFFTEFTSHVFQWPAKPGSHQWREGPFIGDDRPVEEIEEETRMGLIPGVLACPDERRFPYALVTGAGNALLIFPPNLVGGPILGEPPFP
jgi:hypothetical protein